MSGKVHPAQLVLLMGNRKSPFCEADVTASSAALVACPLFDDVMLMKEFPDEFDTVIAFPLVFENVFCPDQLLFPADAIVPLTVPKTIVFAEKLLVPVQTLFEESNPEPVAGAGATHGWTWAVILLP